MSNDWDDDEPWECPKEGCALDAEGHSLALAMEHIYEMDTDESETVASDALGSVSALFGVGPTREDTSNG